MTNPKKDIRENVVVNFVLKIKDLRTYEKFV